MRGRWTSFVIGSAIARRRTEAAMTQKMETDRALQRQQFEIDKLKNSQSHQTAKAQSSDSQEDITQKIQKLAEIHQKGLLTDEEFTKLKMDLLSKL
jgi:hypothetical protein